jgi:magnesium transporter
MDIFALNTREKNPKVEHSNKLDHFKKMKWVRLVAPSEEEILEISREFRLDSEDLKSYLQYEERSHVIRNKGYIEIIFDVPYKKSGEAEMNPIYFIISRGALISIETSPFSTLEDFSEKLKKNVKKFALKNGPYKLLFHLIDRINHQYLKYINDAGKISDIIEQKAEEATESDLNKLYDTNITLTHLNQSLIGNIEVLNTLRKIHASGVNDETREDFTDLYYDHLQTIESLKIQREIVSSLFNFQSILSSNKLNQLIKKLTSFALIFIIPTVITSAYGMNVVLPFQNHPYAFYIVCGISLWLIIMCFLIFKIFYWI